MARDKSRSIVMNFDSFPSREKAEQFLAHLQEVFGLDAELYDNPEGALVYAPHQKNLTPPIVQLYRPEDAPGGPEKRLGYYRSCFRLGRQIRLAINGGRVR
jgi:hypothetical protein